jgi:hypothetical protein
LGVGCPGGRVGAQLDRQPLERTWPSRLGGTSRTCPIDRPWSDDPHEQLVTQIRGAVAEYERTLIVST